MFTHDTHSVSNGVGHLLWRKRTTPLKGFQNRFDKDETLRYVDQAFVTTQGLFSFVYGSLETRARFPSRSKAFSRGSGCVRTTMTTEARSMSLRPMVAAAPPASRSRRCTSARREVQEAIWESHRAPISPKWHTYGMEKTPESILFLFDGQPYHEVSRSAYRQDFDECFGGNAAYHICLTTHSGSIHRGRLKHEDFTQAQVDIDYIVVRAMDR